MRTVYAILVVSFLVTGAQAKTWYLNGAGPGAPYQLWAFGDDGLPLSTEPIVEAGGDARHVAWPSAIQEGSITRVYASVNTGKWDEVRLYSSEDGLKFDDQGVVFSANESEPYGIGPTYVMRDPSGPNRYVMYYLVRGAGGPGESIAVATSPDGLKWTREGNVISASLPEEAGGLSMSYACRMASGEMVLLFHGYDESLNKGVSLTATATTPTSTFRNKTIIKSWDGFSTTVSGLAGQNLGLVASKSTVPLGIPLLIGGAAREHIVAVKQEGAWVWFDRPLLYAHEGSALYSMARNKVEMSYIKQQPDGSWHGIATVYGPAELPAEYTTALSSPALGGTWNYDGTGFRFQAWLPGFLYSLENPTPLISTAECNN
jgi:hypothetical protein